MDQHMLAYPSDQTTQVNFIEIHYEVENISRKDWTMPKMTEKGGLVIYTGRSKMSGRTGGGGIWGKQPHINISMPLEIPLVYFKHIW